MLDILLIVQNKIKHKKPSIFTKYILFQIYFVPIFQTTYKECLSRPWFLRLLMNNLFCKEKLLRPEVVAQRCSVKKVLLVILQNSQENTYARVSFFTLLKKETYLQVLSCEFCEIFKNTFSYRTPPVAASVRLRSNLKNLKYAEALKVCCKIFTSTNYNFYFHNLFSLLKPFFNSHHPQTFF